MKLFEDYIQSLKQLPKFAVVEFEDHCSEGDNCKGSDLKCDGYTIWKPKLTPQGKVEIREWIYV